MNQQFEQPLLTKALRFVAYLVAWLVLSATGFWFFTMLENILFQVSVAAGLSGWAVRAVDKWAVFLFGVVWVAVVFTIEGYLRTGFEKQRLWPRIRRVFVFEFSFAVVLLLIQVAFTLLN
jgi:hypothetical protein